MGVSGLGPFDNDSAIDFVDEFIETASPAGSIRAALAPLKEDRYHEIDEVCHAWAACELVAIAASAGEGYDTDDACYEAAARLRPNRKLIGECLNALPRILDDDSELSELVDAELREVVDANVAGTRVRLERGLTVDGFPRLKVPKIRALQVYAVPVSGKWMLVLYDYTLLHVLDTVYDEQPANLDDISTGGATVLFNCHHMEGMDDFTALGRLRPEGALIESYSFVTISRWSCSSSSDMGNFETSYRLNRGGKFEEFSHEDVRDYPFCPDLLPEKFAELLGRHVAGRAVELPPLPTPAELRDEFMDRCKEKWAPYLAGDGGGPFSFPHVYHYDVSPYVRYWIKELMSTDWVNKGMCLPDDLWKYFMTGCVGACVGAYPEDKIPEDLLPLLEPLRAQVTDSDIRAAVHTLSCILDETSVIPHVLQDDPPRRATFLAEAGALRNALAASLAA